MGRVGKPIKRRTIEYTYLHIGISTKTKVECARMFYTVDKIDFSYTYIKCICAWNMDSIDLRGHAPASKLDQI